VDPLPPYTAVVLAGGRAARLGGRAKPQLAVGGRTMLAAVLEAVADAERRVVVGPRQPVPDDVVLVREEPPGGGPVAALKAGLTEVSTDVVVLLAADLPFLTAALVLALRMQLHADGVVVIDDGRRDQWLLSVWRTAALRTAVAGTTGPTSLRRVLAPLGPVRFRPDTTPGEPPPWLDCDTPADLARARAAAGEPAPTPEPVMAPRPTAQQPEPISTVWPLFRSPGEG
jgi:molybdopterin-guanine dinucleotide biosynthesis protein A